jgi:hypothetical protein
VKRLAAAIALTAALALAPSAAARSFVIQGDYKLGGYAIKRDGSLAGAISEFGRPTSIRRNAARECVVRWRPLGLRIVFYNLGGRDACKPQYGRFSEALITGGQWRTANGLRMGDPRSALFRLYPSAGSVTTSWWALVTRVLPWNDRPYGALQAKLNRGRVCAFVIFYPAGGD